MDRTTADSHRFHIPVLGTGFTIDTPLKVARYGISAVISIVDDALIEQVRAHHTRAFGRSYSPIPATAPDARARRITAYLNLLHELVQEQVQTMRAMPFGTANDLSACFEFLPDCPLRAEYEAMLSLPNGPERRAREEVLRNALAPGSIDVNIMTKLDRQRWINGAPVDPHFSDATAALRGYAKSVLDSAVVLSAGMNPRLFAAFNDYPDFFADQWGHIKKRIILKVSDYRSALIQGTMLAKKGLWTSEFRIESGLNCGGHAFPAKGALLGPILEEFRQGRNELYDKLSQAFAAAAAAAGRAATEPRFAVTVQGGVGTYGESRLLLDRYGVDRVGWGTPFLLVPEAVNIDLEHMTKLCEAGPSDVFLSEASPLGVPFWNLHGSASEVAREARLEAGRPGVQCTRKLLALNTEYEGEPLCTASDTYQRRKLSDLAAAVLPDETIERLRASITAKVCLCMDLAANITKQLTPDGWQTPAITPGPNIVNFSRIVSLKEMIGHIYGRVNLVTRAARPHMFLRELELYLDYLRGELRDAGLALSDKGEKYFNEVRRNLVDGVDYYRSLSLTFVQREREAFESLLERLAGELHSILPNHTAMEGA